MAPEKEEVPVFTSLEQVYGKDGAGIAAERFRKIARAFQDK